jgi:hypothetical protein
MNAWTKMIGAITCPESLVRAAIRRLSLGSVDFRLSLQAVDPPSMRSA